MCIVPPAVLPPPPPSPKASCPCVTVFAERCVACIAPAHWAQGEQQTDFTFRHPGGVISIQGHAADLLYEANVGGAAAAFRSLGGSTPWSDGEEHVGLGSGGAVHLRIVSGFCQRQLKMGVQPPWWGTTAAVGQCLCQPDS